VDVAGGEVAGLGEPGRRRHGLGRHLVHAQRRAEDAGADVGDAGQLEHPLDGAVLAQRAVDEGHHDDLLPGLDGGDGGERLQLGAGHGDGAAQLAGPAAVEEGLGVVGEEPAAVAVDADGHHVEALGVDGGQHVGGRHARDVALGRDPAEEDDEAGTGRIGHGRRP
jgi:hypothetical protein